MSPTGEGAVSLSLEKVQATRDCVGLRDGWAAGAGPGPRAALGARSLSSGLASQVVGFWPSLAATLPPSSVLAPGKWVLRCSRELGLEVWVMKRQQLSRGEAFW